MRPSIACPACAASFRVPPNMGGKKVLCPRCRRPMVIPGGGGGARDRGNPASGSRTRDRTVLPLALELAGVLVLLGGAAAWLALPGHVQLPGISAVPGKGPRSSRPISGLCALALREKNNVTAWLPR